MNLRMIILESLIHLACLIMNFQPSQPGRGKKGWLVRIIERICNLFDPNWFIFSQIFESHFGLCVDQFLRVFPPHDRSTRRKWKKKRIWQSHPRVCRKTSWQFARPRWRTHVKWWFFDASWGVLPGGVGLLWRIADEVAALRFGDAFKAGNLDDFRLEFWGLF